MIRYFLLALSALTLSQAPAWAETCGCMKSCETNCELGNMSQCACQECGCSKGEKCGESRCKKTPQPAAAGKDHAAIEK
jgi:hypothetical protein